MDTPQQPACAPEPKYDGPNVRNAIPERIDPAAFTRYPPLQHLLRMGAWQ